MLMLEGAREVSPSALGAGQQGAHLAGAGPPPPPHGPTFARQLRVQAGLPPPDPGRIARESSQAARRTPDR
eukprot:2226864-Pyramimonas_sp.AAC.1